MFGDELLDLQPIVSDLDIPRGIVADEVAVLDPLVGAVRGEGRQYLAG